MARDDDDPRASYKVYEGEDCKGTYPPRAEARRAQQRLAEAEPPRIGMISSRAKSFPLTPRRQLLSLVSKSCRRFS
jgi:hypothetical protein